MKLVANSLRVITELSEDPGDYPSAAGQFALPDRLVVVEIAGCLEFEITIDDNLLEIEDDMLSLIEAASESIPACAIPQGIRVREWLARRTANRLRLEVVSFSDSGWLADE